MRKIRLVSRIFFISFFCLLTACSDDEKDENVFPSEMNGIYSNKMGAPAGSDSLLLTYSGEDIYGKDVYFVLRQENLADVTLFNILPGETETILRNCALSITDKGYRFSGSASSIHNTRFDYVGEVEKGKLALDLTNIQVADNILTQVQKWDLVVAGGAVSRKDEIGSYWHYYETRYLVWEPLPESSVSRMLPYFMKLVLNSVFGSFLKDITFLPDGNLLATYATMPEGDIDIMDLLIQGIKREEEDWNASPSRMATYYVEGSTLYVIPSSEMILRQVTDYETLARAEDAPTLGGLTFEDIKDVYAKITEWCTTGLPLTIKENSKVPYYETQTRRALDEGDIILYLDKTQIEPFLPLLPLVVDLIPENILSNEVTILGTDVAGLLEVVIEGLTNAETFEVGFYLNKGNN